MAGDASVCPALLVTGLPRSGKSLVEHLLSSHPALAVRIGPQRWVILRVEQFEAASLKDPAVPPRLLRLAGDTELRQRSRRWLSRHAHSGIPDGWQTDAHPSSEGP